LEPPPQEDNVVNSTVDVGWLGAALVLGTIITLGLWLLNKLFPQVPTAHLTSKPVDWTDHPGESGTQSRSSQQHHY
jgi:hypothetical protein